MRARFMILPILLLGTVVAAARADYTRDFLIENCDFTPSGKNPYFSLNPGTFLRLEGIDEDGVFVEVEITVLDRTKTITFRDPMGNPMMVEARVIQEREWADGELVEISRNFYSRCRRSGNIFYFGENVDIYEDGEVVSHDGEWRAGRDGAQPGLIMPGLFLDGSRYYQEVAPGVALDRAKHTHTGLTVTVPAGTFFDCVRVVETTPLERGEKSIKLYAPGIGLIYDDGIELVAFSR